MLIDEEKSKKLGIMSSAQALQITKERGLDLVEVSPLTKPPVCKIMDFGNYLYKQKKNDKKQKSSQKKKSLKTIRLSVRIDQHDLETKASKARKFLEAGNSVKVVLIFRGRETQHSELGMEKINNFVELLGDVCRKERSPVRQGYQIHVLLISQVNKTS